MNVPTPVLVLLSLMAIPGFLFTLLWLWATVKLAIIYWKEGVF